VSPLPLAHDETHYGPSRLRPAVTPHGYTQVFPCLLGQRRILNICRNRSVLSQKTRMATLHLLLRGNFDRSASEPPHQCLCHANHLSRYERREPHRKVQIRLCSGYPITAWDQNNNLNSMSQRCNKPPQQKSTILTRQTQIAYNDAFPASLQASNKPLPPNIELRNPSWMAWARSLRPIDQ